MLTPSDRETLDRVANEPDPATTARLCDAALRDRALPIGWHALTLRLPEELTEVQRRLGEVIHARDLHAGGWGLPSTRRFYRRWAGLDAPGFWERAIDVTVDGRATRWPIWRAIQEARPDERGASVTSPVDVAALGGSPEERWMACGELALENYGFITPLPGFGSAATLAVDAAALVPWARGFADTLLEVYPSSRRPARHGYRLLDGTLAALVFLPLVRAGAAIEPRWDTLLTFELARDLARELATALPRERAERVACEGSMWSGPVINGLDELMNIVDLVPTRRVADVIVAKLRNKRNAGFLKHAGPRYRARLAALAAREPGVREALAPRRAQR